jgi:hypothetical protein
VWPLPWKLQPRPEQHEVCALEFNIAPRLAPHHVPCSRAAACSRPRPYRNVFPKERARVCRSAALCDEMLRLCLLYLPQAVQWAAHRAAHQAMAVAPTCSR